MKKLLAVLLSLILISALVPLAASARDSYVYDGDGLLSQETAEQINGICSELFRKNGCEVYVYVAKTLAGGTCEACASGLFVSEAIGGDGQNGVTFVVATEDSDYYVKAGTGAAGRLTYDDIVSILKDSFEPGFASGDIEQPLVSAVSQLSAKLEKAPEKQTAEKEKKGTSVFLVILIVILFIVFFAVVAFIVLYIRAQRIRKRRRRRRRPGNPGYRR